GTHHVESLVAVKARNLDGHDVFDLREPPPERIRQHLATDGRLKIEADERNDVRDGTAVCDQFVFGSAFHSAEVEQTCVIAVFIGQCGLSQSLPRLTADARNPNYRLAALTVGTSRFFRSQLEN